MTELDSFPVVRVSDDICETFAMHDSHLQVDVVPPSRAPVSPGLHSKPKLKKGYGVVNCCCLFSKKSIRESLQVRTLSLQLIVITYLPTNVERRCRNRENGGLG